MRAISRWSGTEQQSGRPARTQYRLTNFGEDEFFRLLRAQAWATETPVDSFSPVLSFIWTLPRDEVIGVLRHQISRARTCSE